MSNEILKDSFFGDPEISNGEKMMLCALMLGGTYAEPQTEDGKNVVACSTIYKKGGMPLTVNYTFGNENSLTKMACSAYCDFLGINKKFGAPDKIFTGEVAQGQLIDGLATMMQESNGFNAAGKSGRYTDAIRGRLQRYLETERKFNPAVTPEKVSSVLADANEAFLGKKNEMSSN